MAHVVPQWSVLKTPSAMQPLQLGEEPGVTPVRSGPGAALGSRTRAGTWIGIKKPKLQEPQTQVDSNDSHLHALMDMHLNHTVGDLNTPDIKLEDFVFGGTHEEPDHNDSMEVSSTSWDQEADSLTGELHASSSDATAFFDLSPGELQGDHLEQRMCLTKYTMGYDTDGDALQPSSVSTSGLLDSLASTTASVDPCAVVGLSTPGMASCYTNGTGFTSGLTTDLQQHPTTSIPASSTSDQDFEIPSDILEEINKLLPESFMPDNDIFGEDETATSTQLDIMLGQQSPDLLLDAMQNSGLCLEFENLVDASASKNEELPITFGNSLNSPVDSQIVKEETVLQEEVLFTECSGQLMKPIEPHVMRNRPSISLAPSPAAPSRRAVLASVSPSRPQPPQPVATPLQNPIPSVSSGSRPKRTSKKPLRFEDHGDITSMSMDIDIPEEPVASTSSYTTGGKRNRQSLQALSEKEKYHRIRILNNEASKRCRQKRKLKLKDYEKEEKQLLEKNAELKEKLADVERQRDRMKKLINMMFTMARK
ncbi:uncharacterized protein LOC122250107 isoform X1 [Penaeus japonicus]|uniref:uncharacterized protein LOC122250107 isoform X1 n=2 Tax=Penaeus japonicus TaxID=27405 RepID=UPI001C70BDE9|nr:uncharacterized protein LOC122250107 isoform X1 [Penaeus japonicus]